MTGEEYEKPEAKSTAGERGRERQSRGKTFPARATVHGEGNRGVLHRSDSADSFHLLTEEEYPNLHFALGPLESNSASRQQEVSLKQMQI